MAGSHFLPIMGDIGRFQLSMLQSVYHYFLPPPRIVAAFSLFSFEGVGSCRRRAASVSTTAATMIWLLQASSPPAPAPKFSWAFCPFARQKIVTIINQSLFLSFSLSLDRPPPKSPSHARAHSWFLPPSSGGGLGVGVQVRVTFGHFSYSGRGRGTNPYPSDFGHKLTH